MWQLGCIYGFGRLAWVAALHRGWERVGRELTEREIALMERGREESDRLKLNTMVLQVPKKDTFRIAERNEKNIKIIKNIFFLFSFITRARAHMCMYMYNVCTHTGAPTCMCIVQYYDGSVYYI